MTITTKTMTRSAASALLAAALLLLTPACAGEGGPGGGDDDDGMGDGGDGGGGGGGGGGGDGDGGEMVAFRLTDLDIRDPHVFIEALGCQDVTESPVNEDFQAGIREDIGSAADPETPDGLLDLSALVVMLPLDPSGSGSALDVLLGADCTAPMESTSCTPGAATMASGDVVNQPSGACDIIVPDTTSGDYTPAPPVPQGPCFLSDATEGELVLGPFTLSDYSVAATYQGDPATGLMSGVVRGFMSEADAEAAIVTTPIGDLPVASLLAGGEGSCAPGDARDMGPGGVSGWYFYLEFAAQQVDYAE